MHSSAALTYQYQNRDVPRSGARQTVPRPAHNSVRAAPAISWRLTLPAPTCRPKKLFYSFSSSVASSNDDLACRSLNPDSDKTRCVACHCSKTQPLAAEFPRGCVGAALTFSVFRSSSHFTTHASRRKGVLPRRLRSRRCSRRGKLLLLFKRKGSIISTAVFPDPVGIVTIPGCSCREVRCKCMDCTELSVIKAHAD